MARGVTIAHTTDVKLEQYAKVSLPMLITEFPIVTDVKLVHKAKPA